MKNVFVFNGNKGGFPSGVFSSKAKAEEWIEKYNLSGVLTEYPVDISVYDWRKEQGYTGKSDQDIANFSSAHLAHWHYEEKPGADGLV